MKKVLLLMVSLLVGWAAELPAGMVSWRVTSGGTFLSKRVKSVKELRYKKVVRQKLDYSCGSAALATVLKYYYGRDISEEEIVREILRFGDKEKISKRGFSMLDLKLFADRTGFRAEGYKVKLEYLPKIPIPTIVLLDIKGYKHFVVLKGVREDKVYIADPALGNRVMSLEDFARSWNGILLAVFGKRPEGAPPFEVASILEAPREGLGHLRDLGPRAPFLSHPFEIKR